MKDSSLLCAGAPELPSLGWSSLLPKEKQQRIDSHYGFLSVQMDTHFFRRPGHFSHVTNLCAEQKGPGGCSGSLEFRLS